MLPFPPTLISESVTEPRLRGSTMKWPAEPKSLNTPQDSTVQTRNSNTPYSQLGLDLRAEPFQGAVEHSSTGPDPHHLLPDCCSCVI